MRLIDRVVKVQSRSDEFEIIPIGDTHIGSRSCGERFLRKTVREIPDNALVVLGGDIIDAIRPQDVKRFDFDTLPDWMIEGDADTTRDMLHDITNQQVNRAVDIFSPIKDRIIGAVEGNHEHSVKKYANTNAHKAICTRLGIEDLTDEALIRFRFVRAGGSVVTIVCYLRHGYGGGRTPGAEPNKLDRMLSEWECADICFTGHTHTFDILPPKAVLEIPHSGTLPKECLCRYRWAANWGSWVFSHASGPGSYASRACYPARPMLTCRATIRPFAVTHIHGRQTVAPEIGVKSLTIA